MRAVEDPCPRQHITALLPAKLPVSPRAKHRDFLPALDIVLEEEASLAAKYRPTIMDNEPFNALAARTVKPAAREPEVDKPRLAFREALADQRGAAPAAQSIAPAAVTSLVGIAPVEAPKSPEEDQTFSSAAAAAQASQ